MPNRPDSDGHRHFRCSYVIRQINIPLVVFGVETPWIFNILVLIPGALTALFGSSAVARHVFQDKFPESEGIRTILGSLWTAILIGSIAGLFFPVVLSPILIVQVIYKSSWLVVFAVPRWLGGRSSEVPWGITITFLVLVVTYPWVIPREELFIVSG